MTFTRAKTLFLAVCGATIFLCYVKQEEQFTDSLQEFEKSNLSDGEIELKDTSGNVIIKRNIQNWNQPLVKWNPKEQVLAFIHIGKSGGMSFERSLRESVLLQNNCKMKCSRNVEQLKQNQPNCPNITAMLCFDHFDWTAITEAELQGHKMAPIVLFRDPVKRAVSHFYYARSIAWTKGRKIRKQSLGQYLNDTESMMNSYGIWHDGQGAAKWLAGTHSARWLWNLKGLPQDEIVRRENISTNWTYMLDKALNNLHKCLWIGRIEKLDQSLEMLEYQTGLKINMKHINKNRKYPKPTPDEVAKLKRLMPMDLYIYEYVLELFERRWKMFLNLKEGKVPQLNKTLPRLPQVIHGCKSTSKYLTCPDK